MIHYHGTPLGGTRESVARFVSSGTRHFLVPFMRQEDLPVVAEASCGFCLDNSAFSAWKSGKPITDWEPYYRWVSQWALHPRFAFAIIPDKIDGSEEDNDRLITEWHDKMMGKAWAGFPVWHLHESLDRLERLSRFAERICLGSSGEFSSPGADAWHARMSQAMDCLCPDGRPRCKIHGLRMLDPAIVQRYPFASADSTNVAQNCQLLGRFGIYKPPSRAQRSEVIAARMEQSRSPAVWVRGEQQSELWSESV